MEEASDSRDSGHCDRRPTAVSGHTWRQRALPDQVRKIHILLYITQIPQNIKCSPSFPPPSEDLLSLPHPPGRTLVVGGTAEGLECAGFLFGLGLPVTIMPLADLLPGFDKKMAQRIENHLIVSGVEILYHCSLAEVLSEKKTASAILL